MANRRFCFRFDVDSHRCVAEGVPNLLRLADRLDVKFTFFVNMGRLTSRPRVAARVLAAALTPGPGGEPVHKLPLRRKLGTFAMTEVMAFNPLVGAGHRGIVRQAFLAGHEIGLHGGRNHRVWQDAGREWNETRVRAEIRWGLGQLFEAGVTDSPGFSSPGWSGSPTIERVAADYFRYIVDARGAGANTVEAAGPATPLPRVPTNIVGDPGGIGYLEWHRAQGASDTEILTDFRRRLAAADRFAVVYDHPFWAGIDDLAMTAALIQTARNEGFEPTVMADLLPAA